jgi:hypothetical protein
VTSPRATSDDANASNHISGSPTGTIKGRVVYTSRWKVEGRADSM